MSETTATDRVFLITGASMGIGAATARLAARAGNRLVLAARSTAKLEALVGELGGPRRALAVACDVSGWDSQQQMVAHTLKTFGQIDVVFANAGGAQGSTFLGGDDTPEAWRQMVLTNVYGAAVTARLVLPELVRCRGHLLLTGSVVGRIAIPGSLYSATKWAVTGMAESIRQQLVGTGVRVTLVEPGRVDTPFWQTRPSDFLLEPDDVARAVMYAVSQPPHVDVNEILVRPVGQRN
jgi:NADP-dependent 3-hydroxy acid dehydrogenase YdfG